MSPHPRFPHDMSLDIQIVIADEVDITIAGYPAKRSLEVSITAYAEQLRGFLPDDIRAGFAFARSKALKFAPTPTEVKLAVGDACAARRRREAVPPEPEPDYAGEPLDPEMRRAWREALGGAPPEPQRTQYVDGKPLPPQATPISAVVSRLDVRRSA